MAAWMIGADRQHHLIMRDSDNAPIRRYDQRFVEVMLKKERINWKGRHPAAAGHKWYRAGPSRGSMDGYPKIAGPSRSEYRPLVAPFCRQCDSHDSGDKYCAANCMDCTLLPARPRPVYLHETCRWRACASGYG